MGDNINNNNAQTQPTHPLLKPIGNSIQGKIVLVTGANRGIGKAFVESFLNHGASKVYAACRSIESAKAAFKDHLVTTSETPSEASSSSSTTRGIVVPLHLDMSDPSTIQQTATIATDVDIVINNAGVLTRTSPLSPSAIPNLQHEMEINVYGFLHLANAFAPHLEKRGGRGILVQLNSVASMRCLDPSVSTYSASKAASFSVTQALRMELGGRGVHVVSIHPGPIGTDMIADLPDLAAVAPKPEIVAESLIDAITTTTTAENGLPPFLVYPDRLAMGMGKAFQSFADVVIQEGNAYGK